MSPVPVTSEKLFLLTPSSSELLRVATIESASMFSLKFDVESSIYAGPLLAEPIISSDVRISKLLRSLLDNFWELPSSSTK